MHMHPCFKLQFPSDSDPFLPRIYYQHDVLHRHHGHLLHAQKCCKHDGLYYFFLPQAFLKAIDFFFILSSLSCLTVMTVF